MTGAASPNRVGGAHGGNDQHGRAARGAVGGGGALPVGRAGREGADTRRAVRDDGLASQACGAGASAKGRRPVEAARRRRRKYDAIRDALTALWEASDRVCGKRLVVMIPTLLPALERHGRLQLGEGEHGQLLAVSAATIDRMLGDVKVAAAGGRRRRVGFYSAIRREVPIRTFNDWRDPPPGFCEIDMVAHGGTSVAGSFIQTLTMVDVATGWTECLPLVARDGRLVVEAIKRAQSLFPWLLRGADFDNDSAFMNEVVVPWCRAQKIEVTRSRAYKKNDQAFVEQKNGAVVRRLVGYGRFDGVETARVMARLYAAARLYVNFFQPSFKLKEKRREGAKVIKRYHAPATPYERALAHPKVPKAVKGRLREQYRTLDPVALLAEIRAAQEELGDRIDRRAGGALRENASGKSDMVVPSSTAEPAAFARRSARSRARRAARDASAAQAALQETGPHAVQARSARGDDRGLARGGAAADRARHRRPAGRKPSRSVRQEAAFDRAASAASLAQECRTKIDRCGDGRGARKRRTAARGCGRLGLCRARPAHSPSLCSSPQR